MATNIGEVIKEITGEGFFKVIKRHPRPLERYDIALKCIEAIGRQRNDKFVLDNENMFVYLNFVRWVQGDPEFQCIDPFTKKVIKGDLTKGIYLSGNTGSGKSWAIDIISAFSTIDDIVVSIGGIKKKLHFPCIRADTICDSYILNGKLEKFKRMPIIGIQDLGSEPPESLYMGNRLNVLQQILEFRGDQSNLITIITSNLPMNHEALSRRYHDRVSSRLNEMCNYFEMVGIDRRKQN